MARTPAHLAAGTGKYFVFKELESRGANFNARDVNHRTVLHWAARSEGSSRALRYLVKRNTSVRIQGSLTNERILSSGAS